MQSGLGGVRLIGVWRGQGNAVEVWHGPRGPLWRGEARSGQAVRDGQRKEIMDAQGQAGCGKNGVRQGKAATVGQRNARLGGVWHGSALQSRIGTSRLGKVGLGSARY